MLTIGVDPGLSGAIAVCVNGVLREVADLPTVLVGGGSVKRQIDPAALAAIIRDWRARYGVDSEMAAIERVASRPKQGVASVFSLGHSAGIIAGVVAALGVPSAMVAPQVWKRAYMLGKDKAEARAMASGLFPDHAGKWARVKDDGRAEAALLARYAFWEVT